MNEILTWDFWVQTQSGGIHFILALSALVLGPVILVRRKGDKTHRWLGRIWAIMMLTLNIIALSLYDINGKPNLFHFFAVMSLATLLPGLWAIWRYKKTRHKTRLIQHQHFMIWAYFGLAMAGFWQIVTTAMRVLNPEGFGQPFLILGILTFVMAGWLNIYLRKTIKA